MAFEIKLPANPAHYSLEPPPAPPLGGFSTSGPGAAVGRQVEEMLQRIAAVGQAVALGSEAFRRVGGALDPQGAAAWPKDLTEIQRRYERLPAAAQPLARSLDPVLKQASALAEQVRLRGQAAAQAGLWQGLVDQARGLAAAGVAPRLLQPVLSQLRAGLSEAGLFAPDNPELERREQEALLAGALRFLADSDPAAALARLDDPLLSAETRAELRGEIEALQRQAAQAERASFLTEARRQMTALGRGEATEELPRRLFLQAYGTAEGERRYRDYAARRAEAPAWGQVRGRTPAEVEAARAAWSSDPEVFDKVAAADAAERRADPAGYAARYGDGEPDELWEAQQRLGIPVEFARPWTKEQALAKGEAFLALAPTARLAWLKAEVLSLPAEQQPAALAQLTGLGLDQGSPGLLARTAAALKAGNLGSASAYAQRISSEPPGEARNPGSPRAAAGFTSLRLTTDPNQRPQQGGKDLYQQAQMVFPPGGGLGGGGAGALGGGGTSPLPWLPQQEDRGVVLERAIRAIDKLFEPEPVPYEEAPQSNFDALPPPEPEEPRDFDTEEARQIAQELFGPSVTPAEVMPIFQLPGFTLDQFERGAVIEIFPDLSDRIDQMLVVENSRGNTKTQDFNAAILLWLLELIESVLGVRPSSWWGAHDRKGNTYKELYLPNKDTGKKDGSSRTDISILIPGTNIRLHINTVDNTRHGGPTDREARAGRRILYNAEKGEILILIPKLNDGEQYDIEHLEGIIKEILIHISTSGWYSFISGKGWDRNYIIIPKK